MLQGMELTRTNRSGGLTTYISRRRTRVRRPDESSGVVARAIVCAAPTQATTLVLGARREKVKAITLVRQFQDDLFISGCAMWTIESRATNRSLTRATTGPPDT